MITMVARMRVNPENAPAYEALMRHVCDTVRAQKPDDIPYYAFAKSADEADVYVVIEVYRNAEVHAAHMESALVKESLPKSAALVAGGFEIRQYVSDGSAPVKLTMQDSKG